MVVSINGFDGAFARPRLIALQASMYGALYRWGMSMASITIRNLDDEVKTRLRVRAANSGRSMEEEVRLILRQAVEPESVPAMGLGTAIHELFKPCGGFELELPPRDPMRDMPRFD